jgi:hypothetical protein
MKKKLFATLTAVLVLWGAMFATDYLLVRRFQEPIFILRPANADDGGSYVCRGLGYTVTVEKYFSTDTHLMLESVTMTVFGRVIAAAIT